VKGPERFLSGQGQGKNTKKTRHKEQQTWV
jgi:hypothetical protein